MRYSMHYEKPYEVVRPDIPPQLPKPIDEGLDEYDTLVSLCFEGLKKRFKNPIDDSVYGRLYRELNVIKEWNLARQHLFYWDVIKHGKGRGIEFGPGRGAAPSSLVNYCLGITDVNPLAYGLCFERYLNRERVPSVDIDIDCDDFGRDNIIDYFQKRYGDDHVSRVSTYKERDGEIAACGVHGSAIAVTENPIESYVPIREQNGRNIIAYDRFDSEDIGMDLIDILTLKVLTKIRKMKKYLSEDGIDISGLDNLGYDDQKVYDFIQDGNREGLFYVSSKGEMDELIAAIRPDCLEDLAAIIAMYRPGPDSFVSEYVNAKRNPEQNRQFEDSYPKIWESLKCTYGTIIYQEQIIDILSILCGCTRDIGDLYRRAMGKKHMDYCKAIRRELVEGKIYKSGEEAFPGCIKQGINQSFAEEMFDKMFGIAPYAFNKSHAIAYAMLIYKTAYLKAFYPSQFEDAFILPDILGENFDDF